MLIKKREVIEIEYGDGRIEPISKSRWDKFYRPSVYFISGDHFSGLSSPKENTGEYGLGHKGIFKLPWNGFGFSYTADFSFGKIAYSDSVSGNNYHYEKIVTGSLNAGVEYRYSFFRGFGIYTGVQTGYYILSSLDQDFVYSSSPYPTYSFSIGAHAWRIEFGLKYTGGIITRKTTPDPITDLVPSGDRYNLSILQIYWGFNF